MRTFFSQLLEKKVTWNTKQENNFEHFSNFKVSNLKYPDYIPRCHGCRRIQFPRSAMIKPTTMNSSVIIISCYLRVRHWLGVTIYLIRYRYPRVWDPASKATPDTSLNPDKWQTWHTGRRCTNLLDYSCWNWDIFMGRFLETMSIIILRTTGQMILVQVQSLQITLSLVR